AMERLTGVRSTDAIGRSAAAILPLFRDTTLVPLIRRALAGETPNAVELPHTAGDDRIVWLKARCVPWRDDEGTVTGTVVFFDDVSDQQRHALLLLAMEAIGQSLTSSLDLNEVLDTRLWFAPTRRSDIEREGFKATAAAPLAVKDRILGALVVHYWTERTFGSDETAALEFLAKQAAIAIRNASIYEAEHAEATRI